VLTTSIRQRVRDNLNRDDSGIDAKIQDWVNDTKRRIEQALNLDYMRKTVETSHTNAAPSAALPARMKSLIDVQYRKTVPTVELVWTPLKRLSQSEILRLSGYEADGVTLVTGAPLGYAADESNVIVYPKPETGATYKLSIAYWEFSADWAFGVGEEPYLAKFAWQALIDGATALGYAWMGQVGDADRWERRFTELSFADFRGHDMARALEGEISLRPHTGAGDRRPAAGIGWGNI